MDGPQHHPRLAEAETVMARVMAGEDVSLHEIDMAIFILAWQMEHSAAWLRDAERGAEQMERDLAHEEAKLEAMKAKLAREQGAP